jgi:type IV pilus assembly protein PilC
MPVYNYFAIDKEGKQVRGRVTASGPMELESKLEQMGNDLIDYKVEKKRGGLGGGIKPKDMIMFCVHMEELDKAGVPLVDALIDLRDTVENPKMRDLLTDIIEYVKGGDKFSDALRKRKDVFDELFVGLIGTGEETGKLGEAFAHLSAHIKWNTDFRRKIKKAISYPIVLIVVMITVITLMMLFVVPQLVDFLQKQGFELPFYTQALISVSAFFADYWWSVVFGIPGFLITVIVCNKNIPSFKRWLDSVFLKIPGIGDVILKINLARFVKFFSITFSSGLGVLESLEISRKVVTNTIINEAIKELTINISEGQRLTEAFSEAGAFPSLVVRMFKVGEESGNMERSLSNVNFFYEREIDDAVEAMVGMIQPTLLVMMGGLLTWVIAAVFGPVYSSFSNMKF